MSFKIHYRNNLIDKNDSYLISCPLSWDDRNYSFTPVNVVPDLHIINWMSPNLYSWNTKLIPRIFTRKWSIPFIMTLVLNNFIKCPRFVVHWYIWSYMYVAKSFISTYFSCHLKVYLASLKLPLDWSSTSMRFFLVQNNVSVFFFFFQNNALVERINLLHSLICATIHITIAYIVTISNDDLIFQNNALVDQINSIVLYE